MSTETIQPPGRGDVFALADAQFRGLTLVAGFIDEHVRHRVEAGAAADASTAPAVGLLLRVIGWLRTFAKLNHPADYQAAAAGTRAMFEIALDLTFLHFDRKEYPVDKLLTWEQSARLHDAEAVARYIDKLKGTAADPGGLDVILEFPKRFGPAILAARARYWPPKPGKTAKHPSRWTGRTLDTDAEEADKLADRGFLAFYERRYRQVCWNVHGSGLAGVTGLDMELFPGLTAFAFDETARFAIVAAEMAVRFVGKWDADVDGLFVDIRKRRKAVAGYVFVNHPARQGVQSDPK